MPKWLRIPAPVFILLALTATEVQSAPGGSIDSWAQQRYLETLVNRSIQNKLAREHYWHLLLHYRRNIGGGYTSDADAPSFFLAPNGRTNPQAELEATLTKFFSEEMVGTSEQQAQCAFPARYRWLKVNLDFDETLLPEVACDRFKRWIKALDPESVTLIFASAYMNNPSSMFGHTLLRIDQKGQTEQTRILAHVINYAADVNTENGFLYIIRGVSGGFKGFFSIMPYYLKVLEYSDMENRDIWEYRLNFDDEQIERMLMHAWELGNTYFDYFFFKENCSYHLLTLLEISDPELHLTDQFWIWTIPVDTVRLITNQPGLVAETIYRPSRSSKIRYNLAMLTQGEKEMIRSFTRDKVMSTPIDFRNLPLDRQVFVLDTASDYLRYKGVTDRKNQEEHKKRQDELLLNRSALRIRTNQAQISPITESPENGHNVLRAGVGTGWRAQDVFEEVALRLAYHDLLDGGAGYTPGAQIEAIGLRLRYYNNPKQTELENLTFLKFISLFPADSFFMKPSWKFNASLETLREDENSYHNYFNLNLGLGRAVQLPFLYRYLLYAFVEADANYGGIFEDNYRAGGGGTLGLLGDISRRWKLHVFATYLLFPTPRRSEDFQVSIHQRYALHKDLALRLELNRREKQNEAVISFQAYF